MGPLEVGGTLCSQISPLGNARHGWPRVGREQEPQLDQKNAARPGGGGPT